MKRVEQMALDTIDARKDELFALLSRLIQFDSQNLCGDGRERACAEYMASRYREIDLSTELYYPDAVPGVLQSPLYWRGHNTDKRPNASGVLRGKAGGRRVMLLAHTDTMPVGDESAWTMPPFGGVMRENRIYGLGAGDNKSGLAASYFALATLLSLGVEIKSEVVLSAYCDEEFGGGNGALAACLKYPCDDYVNLDGGNYELWATALGGGCYSVMLEVDRVTDDCFPVYRALALLMDELDAFGARRRAELAANPYYAGTQTQASAFRVARFGNLPEQHGAASVDFVFYTTRAKGVIDAELSGIMQRLAPRFAGMGVRVRGFTPTSRFFDYVECDTDSPAFRIMKACAEAASGEPVRVCGSCLTDLSVIMAARGNRAFNFGILRDFSLPGGAHQPDEFVECDQLVAYTKTLALFLLRYDEQ